MSILPKITVEKPESCKIGKNLYWYHLFFMFDQSLTVSKPFFPPLWWTISVFGTRVKCFPDISTSLGWIRLATRPTIAPKKYSSFWYAGKISYVKYPHEMQNLNWKETANYLRNPSNLEQHQPTRRLYSGLSAQWYARHSWWRKVPCHAYWIFDTAEPAVRNFFHKLWYAW